MSEIAISVKNLHRRFGNLHAVKDLSFEVEKGSVCGFIGANAAGKTTTMRILCTLDYPSQGEIEIGGINNINYPYKVRQILGWMPDHFGIYKNIKIIDYLDFYARAFGFEGKERQVRLQEVMEFTDLLDIHDRQANKLSKGMTQRLSLARTLIHDPEVLILDEPAAGLDPKARVELKNLIRLLSDEGKTVLISSHILSELGEMCDSLLFINDGEMIHHGDTESLKFNSSSKNSTFYDVKILGEADQLVDWVATSPYTLTIEEKKQGGRIQLDSSDPKKVALVLQRMIKDGIQVVEFHREESNLEDAFINMLDRQNQSKSENLPLS